MIDILAKNGCIAIVELEGEGNSQVVIMRFQLNLIFWNKKEEENSCEK
jgi:hypothetical protein